MLGTKHVQEVRFVINTFMATNAFEAKVLAKVFNKNQRKTKSKNVYIKRINKRAKGIFLSPKKIVDWSPFLNTYCSRIARTHMFVMEIRYPLQL